jgi:DNA-binding transcriptional regulator YiaG
MDNRTLLAKLEISQRAWGRLCGVNERTARRWFETGAVEPVLIHRLLRFFADNPSLLDIFRKSIDNI